LTEKQKEIQKQKQRLEDLQQLNDKITKKISVMNVFDGFLSKVIQ